MSVSYAWTPITKSEKQDDGTLLVYGPAATSALDRDRQRLDSGWLDEAMPRWMASDGGGGAVREQHDGKRAVGVGVGLSKAQDGTHMLTARIVDPIAVKKIEYGVLKGFSVGIKNPRIEMGKADAPNGLVTGGDVIEVSVVDRPANPECLFQMAKADGAGSLALIDEPCVVEKADAATFGLPTELYDRLPSAAKQALTDLAASGAQVAAEVEPPVGTEPESAKSDAPDASTPLVVNVTVRAEAAEAPGAAEQVEDADEEYLDLAEDADLFKTDFTAAERRKYAASGVAMPDGSFPIPSKAYLRKAIRGVGRGKGDREAVRRHIIKRAAALGQEALVPDNWNADGSLKGAEAAKALLADLEGLGFTPEITKADGDDDAGAPPAQDVADAKSAIAILGKLIVSEAKSLAVGNLNEACDISLLLQAVNALKWFINAENREPVDADGDEINLADEPDLAKGGAKNGGTLAPPFKKKPNSEDDPAKDAEDSADDSTDEDPDAQGDGTADSDDDGEDNKKMSGGKKGAAKNKADDAPKPAAVEPLLTKAEAAEAIKAAVAAALATSEPTKQDEPAAEPDTVTKAELADLVKTAVAEAKAADEERIEALKADLAKANGDIEAIKKMPIPGGPVLTRTADQQSEATKSDAQILRAQAAELLAKADAFSANRDLAQGYRDRARALLAKADA